MLKNIIKEFFIMLLLCIAIILILGVILYEYIPTNRVIPEKQAYSTPENVKTEINEQITEVEKTEISYEITDSDLNIYKQTSSYKPGKKDPFSLEVSTPTNNVNTDNTQSDGTGEGKKNEDSSSTQTDENSTNTFFDDEGIK